MAFGFPPCATFYLADIFSALQAHNISPNGVEPGQIGENQQTIASQSDESILRVSSNGYSSLSHQVWAKRITHKPVKGSAGELKNTNLMPLSPSRG